MVKDLIYFLNRVAILGDTSYGDCCVDEVAAEHLSSDGVIHFGNTCLTPTQRLPVLFIFTRNTVDLAELAEKVKSVEGDSVFLFYDVRFDSFLREKTAEICDAEPRLVLTHCVAQPPEDDLYKAGRLLPTSDLPNEKDSILYLGTNEKYCQLLALTFNKIKSLRHFDPRTNVVSDPFPNIGKELMKRYFLIEKPKDAERIGILVGTLGVSRFRNIIERVNTSIKKSGKKSYTFLVGKPNVPKLANFPEVDVYVMIACPENSIINSKDFMQPVITPFELDVALNEGREWDGNFLANFHELLPGAEHFVEYEQGDSEAGDVSLISGKLRYTKIENAVENGERALLPQETTVAAIHEGGGGEFLSGKSWRGLEQNLGETPVVKAEKGRKGIAFGYENEGTEN